MLISLKREIEDTVELFGKIFVCAVYWTKLPTKKYFLGIMTGIVK